MILNQLGVRERVIKTIALKLHLSDRSQASENRTCKWCDYFGEPEESGV